MLINKLLFLLIIAGICTFSAHADTTPTTLLYHKVLNEKEAFPELVADVGLIADYTSDGLKITGKEGTIRLNKYYSLGERMIRYYVKFSNDAVALFKSNADDFKLSVDIVQKKVFVATNPETWKIMDFLNSDHEYLIEIYRAYQKNIVRIVDVYTGAFDVLELTTDGTGGHGAGIENSGFYAGNQHDYYCFGLQSGTSLLVKQISVLAGARDLFLLIYGDSITEPEGYFPTRDYPWAWTQLIMKNVPGKAISSGRGGCTIIHVLERIKNELPYVKAKYVMVTIGTNGGNTEENLSELVEYILSQGSIPILNNIPCNESSTQIGVNRTIEKIRQKYNIKGCKFDIATSMNHDGREVDKSTMYFEDYPGSWGQIYHHPNVKGSLIMYTRTLIDIPEIYDAIRPN
ncbi:SGNH/GDSL hydrolase family protein [uncultured Proteiniphilum sp.]|uniref:SGNH/GDSL hydrolase family protein n=1 Tax=uncultured Proteiniphilum sp. TaxID=497637 RepID=UPI00260E168E|nr:SGNH/GDSL hydrolase family protein [uncultured Proteiniphilum sp.]